MISFGSKGIFASVMAAIEGAGHFASVRDGGWISSDDTAVQALIDAFPLSAAQTEVVARIDAHARALRDAAVAGVSPAEMAAWPIKRAEAATYDGQDSTAPMLVAEASARGVATQLLVDKVNAKAGRMAMLEAQISGRAGYHADAVRSLNSFEAVAAYDWSSGWPE